MTPGRRNLVILGGVAATAAVVGAITGTLVLQSRSGAADLLSARFPDLSGRPQFLVDGYQPMKELVS